MATERPRRIRIFISHKHTDERLASALVTCLIEALEVPDDSIRCTSLKPYALDVGDSIETLKQNLKDCAVAVGLLTSSSLESSFVVMELGAAWVLGKRTCLVLSPELRPEDVPELLRTRLAIHASDEGAVANLVDVVAREARLVKRKTPSVNAATRAFVAKTQQLYPLPALIPTPHRRAFTLCGQRTIAEDAPAGVPGRERIYRLWADPTTPVSRIEVEVPTRGHSDGLLVRFDNRGEYPGDVTIRPFGDVAMSNPHNRRFLHFIARDRRLCGSTRDEHITLAVRVIDRVGTQWIYQRRSRDRYIFCVPLGDDYHAVELELTDEDSWSVFVVDDNWNRERNAVPDFSVIPAIVVEIGIGEKVCRPGPGCGAVEILGICLSDNEHPNRIRPLRRC
ncbi:MAG TPA: hypothetical protein VIV60_12940 [Polyangiaceae bacterium]